MSGNQDHALAEALCRHLAGAVATLLGGSSVTTRAEAPSDGWHLRLAVGGRGVGNMWVGFAAKDAVVISQRILGTTDEPAEGTVRDTLRELVAQAVSAVVLEPQGAGLDIRVEAVEPSFQGVPSTPPRSWAFDIGNGTTVVLVAWSAVHIDEAAAATGPRNAASAGDGSAGAHGAGQETLDLLLDIDLPMSVRFGRTELALGLLTRLGPGSVIDLGRSPDEPVEVLVSGRVVARGEVVVVGGNFGVRVTDVVHAAGRRH